MSLIPQRLAALRAHMRARGLSHYFVPSADEHLNEYLPEWRKRREYLSGFTGSAGDLLLGQDDAWLFTDGRYHVQAGLELRGSGIQLSKVGVPGQKSLIQHVAGLRAPVLGFDPMLLSVGFAAALERALAAAGGRPAPVAPNLVDLVWSDRPAPPTSVLFEVPLRWSGRSAADKLADVRAALSGAGANALLVTKLDQLAWLLNLRSRDDVPFNPVFEGHGLVTTGAVHVFLHGGERRLPAAIPHVRCHEYGELLPFLGQLPAETRILLDPSGSTLGLKTALETNANVAVVLAPSPVEDAKARKNAAEREGMRVANRRASAVKAEALRWLEQEVAAGRTVTERAFQDEIERRYAAAREYWGLSFNTITATGPHGAIMHYKDADRTPLRRGELFIIDSGIQAAGGTTDDTRTVIIGEASAQQRRLYTRVLQCHIAAATLKFPAGTPGTAVDAVCRGPLWRDGLSYDHGTGHGVGAFLNVHEGPFALSESVRKPYAVHPLAEGMVTSIEPGYYKPGWGGIRIENLYLIVQDRTDESGVTWLRFESLTFIPFDERLIDRALLSEDERRWVDDYHARCRAELAEEAPEPAGARG
ncbi:MAG: M24 family metallopeptidase [Planctomycetota bacterium]|nr:MAG: M24 family metallopeptidase [Planctomycetota bacterium]